MEGNFLISFVNVLWHRLFWPYSPSNCVCKYLDGLPYIHINSKTPYNISHRVFCSALPALRPTTIDPSHQQFNSDRSQLIIRSVARADYGEYVCTATNKIAESSATIMLHVFGWFGSLGYVNLVNV